MFYSCLKIASDLLLLINSLKSKIEIDENT